VCSPPWIPPTGSAGRCTARPRSARAARLPDPARAAPSASRANGAVSNLSASPSVASRRVRASCARGYDVIHIHEPMVPLVGWNAALGSHTPAVGTFHAYSTKALPNHVASALGARRVFNRLSARIAVSEAAAWTGRRWFGGRYEVIPKRGRRQRRAGGSEAARRRAAPGLRRPSGGAQGPAGPADRLRSAGRARPLPPHRDRRRTRGRPALPRRSRGDALDRRARPRLRRLGSGPPCTKPTCSAPPRSPARASAWS
jgi:hypothetical protein